MASLFVIQLFPDAVFQRSALIKLADESRDPSYVQINYELILYALFVVNSFNSFTLGNKNHSSVDGVTLILPFCGDGCL